MYYTRLLEKKIQQLSEHFKAVLVVGARQVGKSTLLRHCFPSLKHITLDPISDEYGARQDPIRFLNNFPRPLILDEIQYCPNLLPPIKRYLDESDQMGQYLLTGSQNLSTLKQVAESMAGRVAIVRLHSFAIDEIAQQSQTFLSHLLSEPRVLLQKFDGLMPLKHSLYEMIWRGSMPGTLELGNELIPYYHASYLQTYIERDVRLLENVINVSDFERFTRLVAALSAQEINFSKLGHELGIHRSTAKKWLDALVRGYQFEVIPPYHGNIIKRISKKPKGFLSDTGLMCYLQYISSPEALASHPLLGACFESFVTLNLLKMASTFATVPQAYHWRLSSGAEVDLVFEIDGKLYPIEMKCKSQITKRDVKGMKSFFETYSHKQVMAGVIIYAGNTCFEVDDNIIAVPWNGLFSN